MRRRTAGQAMVEFMLALPLFLFILLGAIDFGRVVYAHTAISMNAEAAARLASVSAPRADTDIVDRAMRISPAVPYSAANVAGQGGSFYPWGTDANGRVVVNIVVDVPIITPVVSQMVGGAVTVSARAEERVH